MWQMELRHRFHLPRDMESQSSGMQRSSFQVIHERIHHLSAHIVSQPRGFTLYFEHESFEIIARIGNADDAERGPLPQIGYFDFRHRDIEGITQPVFHAAHNLTLVLKGVRTLDAQFQREISYRHDVWAIYAHPTKKLKRSEYRNHVDRLTISGHRSLDPCYTPISAATRSLMNASITSPFLRSL